MPVVPVQQAFELALQHHQAGRLAEAEVLYREVLAVQPGHADALQLLGVVAHQSGHHAAAVDLFRRALGFNPRHHIALSNLGEAWCALGRFDEAVASYRRALELNPGNARTYYGLGNALSEQGQLEDALVAFRKAVELEPGFADAHNNLGVVLARLGRYEPAVVACSRALQLRPGHGEAYNNLGIALAGLARWEDAMAAYRRAIELQPIYPEAQNNLGNALKEQGLLADATMAYRRALELRPDYADAHCNLGIALAAQGFYAEALVEYHHAIRIQPGHVDAHNNLGIALVEQGRLDEAGAVYRQARQLNPGDAEVLNNQGNLRKDQGRIDEAVAAYRQALEMKPDDARTLSNLIYTLHFNSPYDGQVIAAEQRRWNRQIGESAKRFAGPQVNDCDPERPLRIGYVSADFRDHVIGRNVLPLFHNHDRRNFQIFCYSGVVRPDQITDEFRGDADRWRSTLGVTDEALARLIREDGVDILVDLAQHTAGNRLPVFAQQPAPVQVSFAGYPASAGVEAIGYRISDRYLEPERGDETGRVFLIESFWCCDPCGMDVPVKELPAMASGRVTFGSLNNFCKVNEPILRLWAKILARVKDSRLLILSAEGSHWERTLEVMEREGLEPHRVEFVVPRNRRAYLELYHRLDVVLDTFPYNGHTTSLDALWMGVPVVSLAGECAVSRAGLSQLSNLGLGDWVAHSEGEYVEIATRRAHGLPQLAELRRTLRARMEASVLMDGPRFALGIEAAYRTAWREWCRQ
ncbi:MAG: tetratricopeptide repeat protein [Chthoniobacter sp.]|nr:tetratricopeptide repeat protein [Chthoniobacter sp.]